MSQASSRCNEDASRGDADPGDEHAEPRRRPIPRTSGIVHVNPNYDPGAIRGVVESGVRAELRRNPAVMRRLIGVGDESRLATFRVTPGEIVRVQPPRRPWYRRLWAWLSGRG